MAHKRIDRLTAADIERRVSRVESGCWEWTGTPFKNNGYCRVKMAGKTVVAHRAVYEALVGAIPEGLQLDHLCRNRRCVNPTHLEPVTAKVNQARGRSPASENAAKVRCKRGHSLSGDNLFVRKDGRRRCRTCERASQKRLRQKSTTYKQRHAEQEKARRRRLKKASER